MEEGAGGGPIVGGEGFSGLEFVPDAADGLNGDGGVGGHLHLGGGDYWDEVVGEGFVFGEGNEGGEWGCAEETIGEVDDEAV